MEKIVALRMNTDSPNTLYRKIAEKEVTVKVCCEVGVYFPETSNVIDFIREGVETLLVEPDPSSIDAIKKAFKDQKNITLHEVAIFDKAGTIKLSKANASTFVSELPYSPATVNDQYQVQESETFEVPCKKFSAIDTGSIDLLSIDTEGCEWYVVQDLKSEPAIISIETHGKMYVNPYMKELNQWLENHQYKVWFKDKSDTVYFKDGLFNLTFSEKISLLETDIKLTATRIFKSLIRRNKKK